MAVDSEKVGGGAATLAERAPAAWVGKGLAAVEAAEMAPVGGGAPVGVTGPTFKTASPTDWQHGRPGGRWAGRQS